jgi:hypothetical protein
MVSRPQAWGLETEIVRRPECIMKRLSRFVLYVLAASLLVFPTLLPAQTSTNASITGFVRDSSGAIVPNVQVSVRNTDTGVVTDHDHQ